ncbi:MAG: hypothetical protein L3J83_05780 [Proteobacteria bacterium]|nr:hypothetical protein [Pseudomonadota bacterium]
MMKIKYSDIDYAYQYTSAAADGINSAYINRESGQIHVYSEECDNFEELPDDGDDEDQYILMPHKNDFDLGRDLVFGFFQQKLPEELDTIYSIFRRRGAYSKFKNFLEIYRRGQLERWYKFQNNAEENALKSCCDENKITLQD